MRLRHDLSCSHLSSLASTYDAENEKTTSRLIELIRERKDWLGVDFLDSDSEDDSEDDDDDDDDDADEAAEQSAAAAASKGTGKGKQKDGQKKRPGAVRMLDYACGPGMMSRVRPLSPFPLYPFSPITFWAFRPSLPPVHK